MDRDTKNLLAALRRQAALDRAHFFARPGKTASDWRGGRASVQRDLLRESRRSACRPGRWNGAE